MSTFAYRASLVRRLEKALDRVEIKLARAERDNSALDQAYHDGQLAAYGDILLWVNDMENN